jgi:hypothetical protein
MARQFEQNEVLRAEVVVNPEYPVGRGPEDCESVLRLVKGDIVYVLERHESGWWGGHKEGEDFSGWFPGSILKITNGDGDDENSRALERDRRAVASPQKAHRDRAEQAAQLAQEVIPVAEHERMVKELEASHQANLSADRDAREKSKKKHAETVNRLEADNARLRSERDAEKQERESGDHELKARDVIISKQESENRRLKEDLKRKEAELHRLSDKVNAMEAVPSFNRKGGNSPDPASKRDDTRVVEASYLSESLAHYPGTPQGSAERMDARAVGRQISNSNSIIRQLFTQPLADDPPMSARALNRHTSEPSQVGLNANGYSSLASAAQGCVRVVSAAPPRPSPRNIPTHVPAASTTPIQTWRSHSQGAPSPRGAKAVAAMQGIDNARSAQAQVRAIVQDIERRSTSQTPGGPRTVENLTATTPQRTPFLAGASMRAASANAPCASARAQSHGRTAGAVSAATAPRVELQRGRQQVAEAERPNGSPSGSEDHSAAPVFFNMSPIGDRARSQKAAIPSRGISSPSPQPKAISVQDRIRAFQRR